MNRIQVATILGIGLLFSAVIPYMLPRSAFVGSALPDPVTLSIVIALAGVIMIIIAYIMKIKPVPA